MVAAATSEQEVLAAPKANEYPHNPHQDDDLSQQQQQQQQRHHQQQPESSSSSSSFRAKSERSDDLAPILPQQQNATSTLARRDRRASLYHDDAHHHQNLAHVKGTTSSVSSWHNSLLQRMQSDNNQQQQATTTTTDNVNTVSSTASHFSLGSLFTILFVQAVAVAVLEGFRVHQTVSRSSVCILSPTGVGVSYTNLIYRGLVIAMAVYQLVLCIDTLKQRLAAQLYALILFGLLFVIFVGIQALIQYEPLQKWMIELGCDDELAHTIAPPYEYAILAVAAACYLVFLACAIWFHGHFTWYHGGPTTPDQSSPSPSSSSHTPNKRLKKASVSLSTLLALIKLVLFFCFSFAAQLSPSALLNYYTTTMEALLVGALGFVLFTIACYAIQHERPWILGIMTVLAALSIVYFVFRLVTIAQPRLSGQDPYRLTKYSLVYTLLVLIILITLTVGVAIISTRIMLQGVKIFYQGPINHSNDCNALSANNNDTSIALVSPVEVSTQQQQKEEEQRQQQAAIGTTVQP